MPVVFIPEQNRSLVVEAGTSLLDALKQGGIYPDAPCGGRGSCGKCRVFADGVEVSACQTAVCRDMTVTLPQTAQPRILRDGILTEYRLDPLQEGYLAAFDIGTTSVVCFLLDGSTGAELAKSSVLNPQTVFGADVVSRVQAALRGALAQLTGLIRNAVASLIEDVCQSAGISPEEIGVISLVGNPAMQQLFLGISPENLARPPFSPVLTEAGVLPCREILTLCPRAQLLIVPDISGYVGADTLGCLLATGLYEADRLTLLVDIGTNGETVLGSKDRMIACATAAGPALEGANIRFGMRGAEGAIDHVWLENGEVRYSVIGGGKAVGICGSGLLDAVAVGLRLGLINHRGRICNEDHIFRLTEDLWLTQEDIRQVQLAKGAISAGIRLMAGQLGVEPSAIAQVQLAGAFGSFLDPESACRIGLLPEELLDRIQIVGNAAGSGAKLLSLDKQLLPFAEELTERIEFLELAGLKEFPRTFAKSMLFREETL